MGWCFPTLIRRLPAALCLTLLGQAAVAERGPECLWDHAKQRFAPDGTPAWVNGGGSPDFVTTYLPDAGRQWLLLHHCPSDRYLLIVARDADFDAVAARFNYLLETDTPYTMEAIGAELAPLGAGVRRGQGDVGRCDCAFIASIRPLK